MSLARAGCALVVFVTHQVLASWLAAEEQGAIPPLEWLQDIIVMQSPRHPLWWHAKHVLTPEVTKCLLKHVLTRGDKVSAGL